MQEVANPQKFPDVGKVGSPIYLWSIGRQKLPCIQGIYTAFSEKEATLSSGKVDLQAGRWDVNRLNYNDALTVIRANYRAEGCKRPKAAVQSLTQCRAAASPDQPLVHRAAFWQPIRQSADKAAVGRSPRCQGGFGKSLKARSL